MTAEACENKNYFNLQFFLLPKRESVDCEAATGATFLNNSIC
jgi:hypothetical protein